jgi:hypothetical protein
MSTTPPLYSTQWVLRPRCTQLNEYYAPVVLNSKSTPNLLYSTQVFKYSPVFTWGPGPTVSSPDVTVIPSQFKVTKLRSCFIDSPSGTLNLSTWVTSAGTVKFVLTAEGGVPKRILFFKPMSWLGKIRTHRRDESWSASLWQTFFSTSMGAQIPAIAEKPLTTCGCRKFQLDPLGDHLNTCTAHSGAKKAHDWMVDQVADFFRTTHKVKTQ